MGKESQERSIQVIIPHITHTDTAAAGQEEEEEDDGGGSGSTPPSLISSSKEDVRIQALSCPSCGFTIQVLHQEVIHELTGLPAGVKFDPNDEEILEHLEAKVLIDKGKLHPLIDGFIPTIEGDNGICYTHPEKLPGVSKEGQIRHFFHMPSKAYATGTRKRRKVVVTDEEDDGTTSTGELTRWHKTGKTRPIFTANNQALKGYKKILVLYSYYGGHRKPEKTNWIMHQYHLGVSEDEKDGELVVSKVFYQRQPRLPNRTTTSRDGCTNKIQSGVHEPSYLHEDPPPLTTIMEEPHKKTSGVHEPFYLHVDPPLTAVMEEPHEKTRPSSSSTDGHYSMNEMIDTTIKNTNTFGPPNQNYDTYYNVDPPLTAIMKEIPGPPSFTDGHHSINAMNDANVLMTQQWAGDEDHKYKYVNTINIENTNDFGPNQFNHVMYNVENGEERRQTSIPTTLLIQDHVSDGDEESSFMNLPCVASKGI